MPSLLVAVAVIGAPVGQAFAGAERQRLRFAFKKAAHRGRQDKAVIDQGFRERLEFAHRSNPTPGIARTGSPAEDVARGGRTAQGNPGQRNSQ